MHTATKLVAYFRVSTQKQGRSGLGLEGQKASVEAFAKSTGAKIVALPFVEVESGKRKDRPELAKALRRAKALRATLVVAKLDRLARNVAFLSALMESGVDFICCDNPTANRLTIHILAAVAEDEAERISARTKVALAAYKARGGMLGGELKQCRNLTNEGRERGWKQSAESRTKATNDHLAEVLPLMREMRENGCTLKSIADRLNQEGFTTRRGNPWGHVQVKLALDRKACK